MFIDHHAIKYSVTECFRNLLIQRRYVNMWRLCSLTGPVGQTFASLLGGALHVKGMHPHLQWNLVLMLVMSCFSDPDMIGSLASSPFCRCYIRLLANKVKSWWFCCPSVGNSRGFTPTMWKAAVISHHMSSPVPFCSLQILLLLATQWPVRALVKLLNGSPVEALQLNSNTQSHGFSRSTVCFPLRGQRFASRGCTHAYNGTGFS
jgi:hypothetical protein